MKKLYCYTFQELDVIGGLLHDAKRVLDSGSEWSISGCKACIDNALKKMVEEDEMVVTDDDH